MAFNRLLKNARLDYPGTDLKSVPPFPFAVQRTIKYASRLRISGALHPDVFEQPGSATFSTGGQRLQAFPENRDQIRRCEMFSVFKN